MRERPGGGRGRDAAPGAARHEPAHARLGGCARSAQRAGRPRSGSRGKPRRAGAPAPSTRAAACVAGGDGAAVGQGNADDIATSLDNLIENALVHTPEGSTVTITWGREGDEAFIAVLDEGPGISPEDAAAAFQRFRRGAARPAGRGGTGLGLAIVGALAARWGGSASLQPRGRGRHARRDPAAGARSSQRARNRPRPDPRYPGALDAHSHDSCRPGARRPPGRRCGRVRGELDRKPVVHARRGRAAVRRQPGAARRQPATPRKATTAAADEADA